MVIGPQPRELIEPGYLARMRVLRIPPGAVDEVRAGSWTDVVDAYRKCVPGEKALFFGRTVEHSREVAAGLVAAGARAWHLDGDESDGVRDRVMGEFRGSSGGAVLCNCQLFDEGIDVPDCTAVIVGRYTTSTTRWLQMCGRGSRPGEIPGVPGGGKVCTIVDAAGVSYELGLPDEPREWSLEDGEVRERTNGRRVGPRAETGGASAPLAMVERAFVEVGSAADTWVRPEPKAPPKPKAAPKATRAELSKLIRDAKRERDPVAALERIATDLGYKPGWVGHMAGIHGLKGSK